MDLQEQLEGMMGQTPEVFDDTAETRSKCKWHYNHTRPTRSTSRTCDKHTTTDTCPEYYPLIMKQFIVERDPHHLAGSGERVCERLETCHSRQQCRQVCPEWLFKRSPPDGRNFDSFIVSTAQKEAADVISSGAGRSLCGLTGGNGGVDENRSWSCNMLKTKNSFNCI